MGKRKLKFVWVETVQTLVEVGHLNLKFKKGDRVKVVVLDITGTIRDVWSVKTASNPTYSVDWDHGNVPRFPHQAVESDLELLVEDDQHE